MFAAVIPKTVAELRAQADQALLGRQFSEALALYTATLQVQPDQHEVRLRVADALLALGQVQRAAIVYTALARHAAHAGYPLLALVALKVLSTLEPELAQLIGALGQLYGKGSERLGPAAWPSPGDPNQPLPMPLPGTIQLTDEALYAVAEEVGKDLSYAQGAYPERLPPIPLLSELPPKEFAAVLQGVALMRKRPGEVVIEQGQPGVRFYLAARGDLQVTREQDGETTELATLHDGAVFGEMALLSNSPRAATVRAVSDCDLLAFSVEALAKASRGVESIAKALDKFKRARLVSNLMNTSPLFRPLERAQRLDLVRRFVAHDVAMGTDVIREGENGTGLFVLLHGSVDVWKRDDEQKLLLATLAPGDVFGEISLLNEVPASATVTAAERSTVLFLSREYFERLVQGVPEVRGYLEELGDEREMDTRLWLETGSPQHDAFDMDLDLEVDLPPPGLK